MQYWTTLYIVSGHFNFNTNGGFFYAKKEDPMPCFYGELQNFLLALLHP